jgi:hypothetical protein
MELGTGVTFEVCSMYKNYLFVTNFANSVTDGRIGTTNTFCQCELQF